MCRHRCRPFLLGAELSEGMAGMTKRQYISTKCWGRVFYPDVKFKRPCLQHFMATTNKVLFCKHCRSVASEYRLQRGNPGIEHEMNPANQPNPVFRVCAWPECKQTFIPGNHYRRYCSKPCQRKGTKADTRHKKQQNLEIPPRPKQVTLSPKMLQQIHADRLPKAIDAIINRLWP